MLAGTEALGGYLDPEASGPSANGQRFRDFVTGYFPDEYHQHASDLWDFRNGMAHGFSPRCFALTHHNSIHHLTKTRDGALILNAEDFYAAFLHAAKSYFAALSCSQELQRKFMMRLESRAGGSFAVGFVDILDEGPA
jgi:hypothetical protein